MRVTRKGQVTVPQDIRQRLGIQAGSDVEFQVEGSQVLLVRCRDTRGAALVASMRGRKLTMSTDDVMALTRGEGSGSVGVDEDS